MSTHKWCNGSQSPKVTRSVDQMLPSGRFGYEQQFDDVILKSEPNEMKCENVTCLNLCSLEIIQTKNNLSEKLGHSVPVFADIKGEIFDKFNATEVQHDLIPNSEDTLESCYLKSHQHRLSSSVRCKQRSGFRVVGVEHDILKPPDIDQSVSATDPLAVKCKCRTGFLSVHHQDCNSETDYMQCQEYFPNLSNFLKQKYSPKVQQDMICALRREMTAVTGIQCDNLSDTNTISAQEEGYCYPDICCLEQRQLFSDCRGAMNASPGEYIISGTSSSTDKKSYNTLQNGPPCLCREDQVAHNPNKYDSSNNGCITTKNTPYIKQRSEGQLHLGKG